jgi:hypothetical protein
MKDGKNIGEFIPHNFMSQNRKTSTITVDIYDIHGLKLIEGVTPVNLIHENYSEM